MYPNVVVNIPFAPWIRHGSWKKGWQSNPGGLPYGTAVEGGGGGTSDLGMRAGSKQSEPTWRIITVEQ